MQNLMPTGMRATTDRPALLHGRYEWTGPFGHVRTVADVTEFDFHMEVGPDAIQCVVNSALQQMANFGFEPLDEEECEPELLENGWTRIYFTPVETADDTPLLRAGEQVCIPHQREPLVIERVPTHKLLRRIGFVSLGLFSGVGLLPKTGVVAAVTGVLSAVVGVTQ